MSENWVCPFCQRPQTVVNEQQDTQTHVLDVGLNKFKSCAYTVFAKACANKDCREVELSLVFGAASYSSSRGWVLDFSTAEFFKLRPESHAKPQPPCVPEVLSEDYYEACAIRDLSPKASATLCRRVLQGMIRDFCGIKKNRLVDEITELEKLDQEDKLPKGVESETIQAMHHIRELGNIGAHMEKDIGIIVDVDPDEAQALIELIEMLFDEWYVKRDQRQQKLASIKAIAEEKKDQAKLPAPKN